VATGLLICLHKGVLVALGGVIKTIQNAPDDELALAKRRMEEVEDGE